MDALHEDQCTFFVIYHSVLLRIRNVSDKTCRENQMTIWLMCIACWIPKATNTISEYVLLIAFLLQQWLHESA